jgi:Ras-related C3 botulinum toxin substrate 1
LFLPSLSTPSENVRSKWFPELNHYAPKVPFILVGTKTDLRDDPETLASLSSRGQALVTNEAVQAIINETQPCKSMECSALKQIGLKALFDNAVLIALGYPSSTDSVEGRRGRATTCSLL